MVPMYALWTCVAMLLGMLLIDLQQRRATIASVTPQAHRISRL